MNLKLNFKNHKYYFDNEFKIPVISVSEILNNYLESDYSNIPPNILLKAANRGQWVHKVNQIFLNIVKKGAYIKSHLRIDLILNQIKPIVPEKTYKYCEKSLYFLNDNLDFIKDNPISLQVEIEKSLCWKIEVGNFYIAGTPDLIYWDEKKTSYIIIDYKTCANLDEKKLYRYKLQLTAYYWLFCKNKMYNISDSDLKAIPIKTYIYLINEKECKKIKVEITEKLLHEWFSAINKYIFNYNQYEKDFQKSVASLKKQVNDFAKKQKFKGDNKNE